MAILRRRRATDHNEVDTEGSWAISYGDMITLLLTFFILFFSTDKDRDRKAAMDKALMEKLDQQSTLAQAPAAPTGQDPQFEEEVRNRLNAKVHKVGQKLIIEFPNVSFYGFGEVKVTQEGAKELAKFVKLYMPYAGNYVLGIRAYTDNKSVRKAKNRAFADNLELSALRSVAAMRSLQKLGIPMNRMRLGGLGELRLTAEALARAIASEPNSARTGLALARKVVLVIEPEPKEEI